MRVFLDANILLSASIPESRIKKLLIKIQDMGRCFTNEYAIEEAKKNISIKRFGSATELEYFLEKTIISNRLIEEVSVPLPPKDIPILSGAIALECDYLLTGDKKDFGFLFGKKVLGVKVVSPQMMAVELSNINTTKKA